MIIIQSRNLDPGQHLVVLFGVGLIGGSIRTHLVSSGRFSQKHMPFTWQPGNTQLLHKEEIIRTLGSAVKRYIQSRNNSPGVTFVWSAGSGDFFSSNSKTDIENTNFSVVLDIVRKLRADFPAVQLDYYFISSAGALYEGQRYVDRESIETPMCPYGTMKLNPLLSQLN